MSEHMVTVRVDEINDHDMVYFSHLRARDPRDMIYRGVVFTAGSVIRYRHPVYDVDVVSVYDRVHHLMLTLSPERQVQVRRAPRKGLVLEVYRASTGDHTLGGITSRASFLTVTGVCEIAPDNSVRNYPFSGNSRLSAPSEIAPEVIRTIRHQTAGTARVHFTPAENPGWHYANSGNYAGARDPAGTTWPRPNW